MRVHIVGGSYSGRELELNFLDGDDIELVRWHEEWHPPERRMRVGTPERYKPMRYGTVVDGTRYEYWVAFYVGDK